MNDYLKKRQELILAGRPLKTKDKKPIAKKSEKRIQKEKEMKATGGDVSKLALDKWFYDIQVHWCGTVGGCRCQECGSWIPQDYVRAATAHLLPKKLFKSVAIHPLNYLILGAGCGCHDKTHRVDKFVKMKVWPIAAERIKQLIPLLPVDELRHISNQLTIALDNS